MLSDNGMRHLIAAGDIGGADNQTFSVEASFVTTLPVYATDNLVTFNGHTFTQDPAFVRARDRSVQAAGWDYNIAWRLHTVLWAAATAQRIDGEYVECGTGRGFMASAICQYLDWKDRPFTLFDTFEPYPVDETGNPLSTEKISHYADGIDGVIANFAEWPAVRLVKGFLPGTLDSVEIDKVAFLHIDLNSAPAEEGVVRHFWPRLATGAIVVFDDYGFPGLEAQREGADRLAAELDFSICMLPTGQGLVVNT